ncbi:MAG: zinc ribbon domain-containing protein [Acidimicrobiales bacterium]
MAETASFCASCGSRLEPGAHFCGVCGHAVGGATGAAAGAPTTGAPTETSTAPTPATGPVTAAPPGPAAGGPPPYVPPGTPPGAAPAGAGGGRAGLIAALAIVGAIALIAAVVAVVLVVRDTGTANADELVLEPIAATTPDPFTPSVTTGAETTPNPGAVKVPANATNPGGQQVPGSQPALYGGTKNNATCNPDQLISFLQTNPDKGRAWAGVLGINPTDIATYVKSLTPITLTRDTRVTNHGYANGRATTIPAVLQAGTAVLVDRYGIPRVKCGCGNPLTEPPPITTATKVRGTQWANFSIATTIVVTVNVHVDVFVLVNPTTGDIFDRPPGTTGTADTDVPKDQRCRDFPTDPTCQETTTTTTTLPPTAPPTRPPTVPPTIAPTNPPTVPPTSEDLGSSSAAIARVQSMLCGQGGTIGGWSATETSPGIYRVTAQVQLEGFDSVDLAVWTVDFNTQGDVVSFENALAAELMCLGGVG